MLAGASIKLIASGMQLVLAEWPAHIESQRLFLCKPVCHQSWSQGIQLWKTELTILFHIVAWINLGTKGYQS